MMRQWKLNLAIALVLNLGAFGCTQQAATSTQPAAPTVETSTPTSASADAPALVDAATTDTAETATPADTAAMHPKVLLETNQGNIVLELDAAKAPITVLNFTRYVKEGFYNGLIFHRVIPGFMIQGGGMTPDMKSVATPDNPQSHGPILNEWRNGLPNKRGTIAMARLSTKPDSASSEFFINDNDNYALDVPNDGAGYAVFGRVIEGMETVSKIAALRTRTVKEHMDVPVEPVVITSAKLIEPYDEAATQKLADATIQAFRDVNALKDGGDKQALLDAVVRLYETQMHQPVTKTPSGLMYFVWREGHGKIPGPEDTIRANFVGMMLNMKNILGSYGSEPPVFKLKSEIAGWREGVGMMKAGEKRVLIIPPQLGYGNEQYMLVPPNSWLIYEIELLSVKSN